MDTQLYIPKKIKVGYQNRSDTYTKKLAYITYYDDKGTFRKEKSWNSWRDNKIEPEEFDNVPQEGFILNKGVQRCRWSHFGSNRSLIRVYDPRGIEFEITPENLMYILMHDNCSKRELESKYVYSWFGKELILLPVITEEYKKSTEFTNLQGKKFSARDLKPGYSYKTKRGEAVVYIGRHNWYEIDLYGSFKHKVTRTRNDEKIYKPRDRKKFHIFTSNEGKTFITKNNISNFIAIESSDEKVNNYADIFEKFQNNIHSSKIISIRKELCKFDNTLNISGALERSVYFLYDGEKLLEELNINQYSYSQEKNQLNLYSRGIIDIKNNNGKCYRDTLIPGSIFKKDFHKYSSNIVDLDKISELPLSNIYITLENGKEVKLKSIKDL